MDVFPKLSSVVMTDILEEVVKVAKSNLLSATEKANDRVRQIASLAVTKVGDLLLPLEGEGAFDLIYELVRGLFLVSYWSVGVES